MYDKYLICEEGFHNVTHNGETAGFEFKIRIAYYRGLRLSMVEGFEVSVDQEEFPMAANLFTAGGRTYTFEEMEKEPDGRWEFGEKATLFVPKPGGLAAGKHAVQAKQFLRISYSPTTVTGEDKKSLELGTARDSDGI
jgi:hypothetical protein